MIKHDRRNFLKLTALSAGFLGLSGTGSYSRNRVVHKLHSLSETPKSRGKSVMNLRTEPIEQVKVAFIGLGSRGSGHVNRVNVLYPKARVTAICDIRKNRTDYMLNSLKKSKQHPEVYTGSKEAWKDMLKRDDIDLVIVSTPWNDHAAMCVYAMQQGKHVATEVPAAMTLEESWALVNTAEETQKHCMMLENVCYGAEELWILNMVKNNVFGTLTYAEAGYIHNLKGQMFNMDPDKGGYYKQWRIRHHVAQDGNLYPTHGLGPVAQYLGIERGDRFDHLVSMSSLPASLNEYSLDVSSGNEFYNRNDFKHGDMNNSLIRTHKGRSVLLQHDVVTPRPYSRINALAGTKAYHEGYPSRLSLSEKDHGHNWLKDEEYREMRDKYQHPIWNKLKKEIEANGGHGGMDFLEFYRLIDNLNKGLPLDMDVYDGADWSVIIPLSKISVELGSVPVRFPDFTRGKWQGEREPGIMKYM